MRSTFKVRLRISVCTSVSVLKTRRGFQSLELIENKLIYRHSTFFPSAARNVLVLEMCFFFVYVRDHFFGFNKKIIRNCYTVYISRKRYGFSARRCSLYLNRIVLKKKKKTKCTVYRRAEIWNFKRRLIRTRIKSVINIIMHNFPKWIFFFFLIILTIR